jgi:methionyl-tRNA formyltransferase
MAEERLAMKIAVVTGELAHHKHVCATLAERHDVLAIVHPVRAGANGVAGKLRRVTKELHDGGLASAALRALGHPRSPLAGWNSASDHERAERRFFPHAEAAYARLSPSLVRRVADPNDAAVVELIRRLRPDAVVCLGGPIYRQPLIDACALMINFHSGVSPLYNGASTIEFAYANGHMHLCGGTLMTMSTVTDGGDILAHYFPSIEEGDTPATLFMKTIRGGAELFNRFLLHLDAAGTFAKCRQPPALFSFRSRDWTVYQSRRIRYHVDRGTIRSHLRDEEMLDYWASSSDEEARANVAETLSSRLRLV